MQDTITLSFTKIEEDFSPPNPDGTLGTPVKVIYDSATNIGGVNAIVAAQFVDVTVVSDPFNVNTSADLSVTKTGPASVNAGSNLTYTITVTNKGPNDAQNVSLTDTLPAGTSFLSQTQTSGAHFSLNTTGNAITDTISTLAAGASATFTFTARANVSDAEGTILRNTANVSADTADPTSGNNSSTANTTVNAVVVGEFQGFGVQLFLGANNWLPLTSHGDATLLVVDPADNIYGEFPHYGVQKWLTGTLWQRMTSVDASVLAAGGTANMPVVVGEFPGYGVSQLLGPNNLAKSLTSTKTNPHADATLLAVDPAGNIYGEFPGYGVQQYLPKFTLTWQQLTPSEASVLAAGGSADHPVLVGEFQGYGISQLIGPNNWKSLQTPDAGRLAVDAAGDVFAALVHGIVGEYPPSSSPQQLTTATASLLAVKTNGDFFADLAGIGIVRFFKAGGQQLVASAHASVLAAKD